MGLVPLWSAAQMPPPTATQDTLFLMPVTRALGDAPAVSRTGELERRDSTIALMPISAALAVADLAFGREQFLWLFPTSDAAYPADSIQRVETDRAADWTRRLRAMEEAKAPSVTAWQLVYFAEAAARAGNDTLARRLFETRLAQLKTAPAEQSYVLTEAIETFTDTAMDSVWLARTVPWAESYATRLHALPTSGYRTSNDSTSVLYRHVQAEGALIFAYDILGDVARVAAHTTRLFAVAEPIAMRERGYAIEAHFPYHQVYHALSVLPDAATHIQALNEKVLALDMPSARAIVIWMGMLGHPAPPLAVHLWLGTSDTVYHDTSSTIDLTDGKIHVLGFGRYESTLPYVLARVQRQFPTGVGVIFAMRTEGYRGIDILGTREEAAWLDAFFAKTRHVAIPVAVWAPAKVREGDGMVPPRSPSWDTYFASGLEYTCLVIDTHGIVRDFYDLRSRKQEAGLLRTLRGMLSKSAPSGVPASAVAH